MTTTAPAARGLAVFAASLETMAAAAQAADAAGFESVWTSELYNRSATVTLAVLAQRTRSCSSWCWPDALPG